LEVALSSRKDWISQDNLEISLNEQLILSGVSRTAYYYEPVPETAENLRYMELIDYEYTKHPFYGTRRMRTFLERKGYQVNRKRIIRLMRLMELEAIYPKPNLSKPRVQDKKYPYLLRNMEISAPNQVWATDITYIPLKGGFLYLTVIMDWFTRYILSWRLSNTLDVGFCLEALEEALTIATPSIFNSDQGSQYTSKEFTGALKQRGIQISMDGKGRAFDNIFVERLWRTIKYEEVYLKKYEAGVEARQGLSEYLKFYNVERPHQVLNNQTPQEMYFNH
jgi:putative transposase